MRLWDQKHNHMVMVGVLMVGVIVNWGEAASASDVSLEPGLWSLDNFGEVLIAAIANGKTFTWNAGAASATSNRASTTTSGFATGNNPTDIKTYISITNN